MAGEPEMNGKVSDWRNACRAHQPTLDQNNFRKQVGQYGLRHGLLQQQCAGNGLEAETPCAVNRKLETAAGAHTELPRA